MLETVSACPMCESVRHQLRFEDVPDFVFSASDERWKIEECSDCGSLFLPQRPDVASIGRYYEQYYTHDDEENGTAISGISVQSGLAKKLANSWRNHKYGTVRPSLGALGAAIVAANPLLRGWIEAESRHLPVRTPGAAPLRVLDVGHGDARFLRFVREIGCQAAGVEIDPKAVAQAQADGLDVVQGDIDAALDKWGAGSFDYITLSHVIEHVHDPRHVFGVAEKLLRSGGRLWIECPNPAARGLRIYRARWRDLDPPRHICIPSFKAMRMVAEEHGLDVEGCYTRPLVAFEVYPFSARASGRSNRSGYFNALRAEVANSFRNGSREWQTVTFRKAA